MKTKEQSNAEAIVSLLSSLRQLGWGIAGCSACAKTVPGRLCPVCGEPATAKKGKPS